MEVKGTVVASLPLFVEAKFGKENLQKWIDSLPGEAQKIFNFKILAGKWYPINELLKEPTQKICDLYYKGSLIGAVESGRFSAEYGLKGMLRIFLKHSTPYFLISGASSILSAYYRPCKMSTIRSDKNSAVIRITKFPEINSIIEHRILGWMEYALESQGCRSVSIQITDSLADGKPFTQYQVNWT